MSLTMNCYICNERINDSRSQKLEYIKSALLDIVKIHICNNCYVFLANKDGAFTLNGCSVLSKKYYTDNDKNEITRFVCIKNSHDEKITIEFCTQILHRQIFDKIEVYGGEPEWFTQKYGNPPDSWPTKEGWLVKHCI